MGPLAQAALAAIIAIQPSLPISSGETYTTRETRTVNGNTVTVERSYTGFTVCTDGRVEKLVHNGRLDTFEHELLHAYDCVDDGEMNGSPKQFNDQIYPPVADPAHAWVYWAQEHPEWAIALLVATGRAR